MDSEPSEYFDQRPRYRSRFFEQPEEYRRTPQFQTSRGRQVEEPALRPKTIAELKQYIEQKQQKSGKSGEAPGAAGAVLKPGSRVRHEQFGDGIVLNRERSGDDVKLVIAFSRVGRKTLVERYAKLKAL
jgi:hypothetical protein